MTTLPARMTVIGIKAPGGPEMLVPEQRDVPKPGKGEILVKVAAAGVNRPDVRQRQGSYPPPKGAGDIPGLEIAGEVVAIGEGVTRWKLGDKVCALVVAGGYAEYCLAHESHALPVPPSLSMVEAAAIPETFFTVWQHLMMRSHMKSGEWVLVHGGTSGIGTTAIMLAKAFGGHVITTAGSDEKCAAAKKLGADVAVNYKTAGFRRGDQEGDRRQGRRRDPRHRRRRLYRPQLRRRGRSGPHRAGVVRGRAEGDREFRQADGEAPRPFRLDAAPAHASPRRPRSRRGSRRRSGRWSRPARSSR